MKLAMDTNFLLRIWIFPGGLNLLSKADIVGTGTLNKSKKEFEFICLHRKVRYKLAQLVDPD